MNFQKYYGKQKVYTYIIKMTSTIDFNTLPENAPSMCIPRVFKNVTRDRISAVFRDLDLGIIDRIDMVSRENEKGDKFQRVFVHFKKWFRNENADRARDMLIQGKEIKVIYDDPWFWKISANKSKPSNTEQRRKPQISFDSSPRRPRAHVHVPRSPSNSPPRQEGEVDVPIIPKKRRVVQKPPTEKKEILTIDEN
jgi:hypothetical protein